MHDDTPIPDEVHYARPNKRSFSFRTTHHISRSFFCLKIRAGVAQWHREPVPAMHYNIDENHPVFKKIDKGTVFVDSLKTGCFDLIFFKYKIKN
jgi:hypothetical protein